MDGLREYQRRRLDLADMIRAVLHIARGYGDDEREQEARQLLARLAGDRFRLAVAGQFSRGKSTLMNALLGAACLPMGALPVTSVVTTVRYGSRARALIRRRGSPLAVEAPLAEVARFVAQASTERSELRVTSVEVEVPAEILRLGFEFADTPGIGSAVEVSTATTARFLPRADAVLVVTGFDSPLTQAEADLLTDAGQHAGEVFLVINKRDLVSAREAAEVTEYVRHWLRDHLQLSEPRVFALSALEALEATVQGDHERLAASGILSFQAGLTKFLATEKARISLRNIAGHAVRLAAGQRGDLRLGRLAADGGADREAVAAAFDARLGELRAQERAVADRIASRVRAGLPGLLADRAPAWQASLRELIAPSAEGALPGIAGPSGAGGLLPDALGALERAALEPARDWLDRRAAEVDELIVGMSATDIGTLLQLARSPRRLGAEIAGLAVADDLSSPARWSAEDVPGLAAPRVDWSIPPPRRPAARRWLAAGRPDDARATLANALSTAISGFAERAREAFDAAALDWLDRLADQADRQTTQAADQFRAYLRAAPPEQDLAALDDLAGRLARFQASLDTWNPSEIDTGEYPAQSAATAVPASDCAVCSKLEATLTERLRRDQFLLATREYDQARHAQAGGFCPQHTWQYAAVASPLGIAAGSARLAEAVADALEAIGQHWGNAGDMSSGVTGLIRGSTCSVCVTLADCEASEIARLASLAPAGASTAGLCLRHIALVLDARPDPGHGEAMIGALAGTLRRAAEDMRAYALKREALHSGLVTDEESRAHTDALRLLAGHQALARPWDSGPHAGRKET
jgi:hypothetical protein